MSRPGTSTGSGPRGEASTSASTVTGRSSSGVPQSSASRSRRSTAPSTDAVAALTTRASPSTPTGARCSAASSTARSSTDSVSSARITDGRVAHPRGQLRGVLGRRHAQVGARVEQRGELLVGPAAELVGEGARGGGGHPANSLRAIVPTVLHEIFTSGGAFWPGLSSRDWQDPFMALIEARGLAKAYDGKPAVRDLSFEVRPGSVTGFLGPNGAGKSTTMRLMLQLDDGAGHARRSTGSRSRRCDSRCATSARCWRRSRSTRPARPATTCGCWPPPTGIPTSRVDEVLGLVGLTEVAGNKPRTFSMGMGQRLGLAGALLGDPHTLILDEPANGLDPQGIQWMRQFLKALAGEGRSVFVSSHLLSEMALLADELVVIGRGRMISSGPVSSFIERASHKSVLVHTPQVSELGALLAGRARGHRRGRPGGRGGRHRPRRAGDRRPGIRPPDPAAPPGASDGDARGGVPGRDGGRRGVPGGGRPTLAAPDGQGSGMIDALRYEWARIRTIRSTWWLTGSALGVALLISVLLGWVGHHEFSRNGASADEVEGFGPFLVTQFAASGAIPSLVGFLVAMIGIFAWGHEYRHGMIRASLTALNSRQALWTAKYVVVAVWVAVVSLVAMLMSGLIGLVYLHRWVTLFDGETWSVIAWQTLSTVLLTWLAMAFTALTRSQAFALVTIFLWPLLIESLFNAFFQLVPGCATTRRCCGSCLSPPSARWSTCLTTPARRSASRCPQWAGHSCSVASQWR